MERVRIGILGLNFGKHILEQIESGPAGDWLEAVAVCDRDDSKAAAAGRKYDVPAYKSLDHLLTDDRVEAVGLFCGPVGRGNLIRKIVQAGKHVLTTKPFELDPLAAARALQEARRYGRVVHLNSPSPVWHPDMLKIAQWQRDLDLGRPIGARAEVWARYGETADGTWYDDPKLCPVAPVFRLGVYLIQDLIRLMGEPVRVAVLGTRVFTGRPTADNGQLSIEFRNSALGNVFASFCIDDGQVYRNSLTVNYERGTIYRNVGCGPERSAAGCELVLVGRRSDGTPVTARESWAKDFNGIYAWQEFAQAVRGHAGSANDDEVISGVRVLAAMARADAAAIDPSQPQEGSVGVSDAVQN